MTLTQDQIARLAETLRKAGFVERTGRPRKGEKALRPALEAVLGISRKQARSLLGKDRPKKDPHRDLVGAVRQVAAAGRRLGGALEELPAGTRSPQVRALARELDELGAMVEEALVEAEEAMNHGG